MSDMHHYRQARQSLDNRPAVTLLSREDGEETVCKIVNRYPYRMLFLLSYCMMCPLELNKCAQVQCQTKIHMNFNEPCAKYIKEKQLYKVQNCRAADSACSSTSALLLVQLGLKTFVNRRKYYHKLYLANLW